MQSATNSNANRLGGKETKEEHKAREQKIGPSLSMWKRHGKGQMGRGRDEERQTNV